MKTIDTIRDEIAGMMGWVAPIPDNPFSNWHRMNHRQELETKGCGQHPIPTTLDGIAAMMPEGWRTYYIGFQIETVEANAMNVDTGRICKATAPTELEARTRLLHAVLTATKGAAHEK